MAVIRPPMFAGPMLRHWNVFTHSFGRVRFGGGVSFSLRSPFCPAPPLRWASSSELDDVARATTPIINTSNANAARGRRRCMGDRLQGDDRQTIIGGEAGRERILS